MANNAPQRKVEAIKAMHGAVPVDDRGRVTISRTDLVLHIEGLLDVVRSKKWNDAVMEYADLVADKRHDLDWAYGQGGIWFGLNVL